MFKERHIFIFTGLGDNMSFLRWSTRGWENKYGVKAHVVAVGWYDKSTDLQAKLIKLSDQIKPFISDKKIQVSFLGISAGASLAINIWRFLVKKRLSVNGGIIVNCGRVKKGNNIRFRTLKFSTYNSYSYRESIIQCKDNLSKLSPQDKQKILTFRALFDEIVPASTTTIEGATNILLPTIEHAFSIGVVMTLYSRFITDFISKIKH